MLDIQKLQNFLFFDSKGQQIEMQYDSRQNVMHGALYLPEVSVGLIECVSIHVLESVLINNVESLIDPRMVNTVSIEYDKTNEYAFYEIENPYSESPNINVLEDSIIDYSVGQLPTFIRKDGVHHYVGNKYSITTSNSDGIIQSTCRINCLFKPTKAGSCYNSVSIYLTRDFGSGEETTECIAQIDLYSEAIAEDERLVKRLADFGEHISDTEEYIFRNSDINEDNPNYRLLNAKRKEFLIELHNIKPYLSSYKGIINILNLFDYPDLKLKEYWVDTTSGKTFTEEVNNYETRQLQNSLVYNPSYKKTTFFGLFYQYNIVTGGYDEDGLPIVQDNFLFSNDEIIIKLFGLKNWIKDREIGGISSIIDIVGEWTFFNKYNINQWTDSYSYEIVDETAKVPSFSIAKSTAYIEDIRPRLENWNSCRLPRDKKISEKTYLDDYNTCKIGWFGNSQYQLDTARGHDEPNIPIGAVIPVINTTFDLKFRDAKVQYSALTEASTTYDIRWNNLSSFDNYEVEWIIRHIESSWSDSIILPSSTRTHEFVVPYVGHYSITLCLHNYGNSSNRLTKHSIIEVKTYEPDFLCYFRFIDQDLQRYKTNKLQFKDVHVSYGGTIYDNKKYAVDEAKIKYCTTTLTEYRRLHALDDDHVRFDGLKFRSFNNIRWDQYQYHTWDNLLYKHVRLSKFIIKSFIGSAVISINDIEYKLPAKLNCCEYQTLADLLSIKFRSYQFTVRTIEDTQYIECLSILPKVTPDVVCVSDGIAIECEHVLDTTQPLPFYLKQYSSRIQQASSVVLPHSVEFPFSMENVRIYYDYCDCPILTPIFFTIDNSEMVGKTDCEWVLSNEKEELIRLSNSNYFCYYFSVPGQYSLSLVITDSNGNKRKIEKKRLINVHDSIKFKQLEYAR